MSLNFKFYNLVSKFLILENSKLLKKKGQYFGYLKGEINCK